MTKSADQFLFLLTLRQFQAPSQCAQAAYERLENAIAATPKTSARTVILDWLKAELLSLRQAGPDADRTAMLLIKDAVDFAKAAAT